MDEFNEPNINSTAAHDVDLSSQVTEDEEIITGPEVDCWLRISPTTRWRWTKLGRLPTPFRLHPRGQNLYRKREIRALIDSAQTVEIYQKCDDQLNQEQSRDVQASRTVTADAPLSRRDGVREDENNVRKDI